MQVCVTWYTTRVEKHVAVIDAGGEHFPFTADITEGMLADNESEHHELVGVSRRAYLIERITPLDND